MPFLYPQLLGLHLLIVGAASAAPLICVWLEWKEGRGDSLAGRAGRFLAGASFWLLWIGAVLGLLMGWLAWRPEFREGLLRLGPRLHFAGAEWVFSVVLIGAHCLWWKLAPRPRGWLRFARALLPLLASTNLLYHFPMLFHVLEQLIAEGAAAAAHGDAIPSDVLSGSEFRQRMMSAPLLARAAHFWLASFVAAGLLLVWHGRSILGGAASASADEAAANAAEDVSSDNRRAIVWGARWALVAAFLQLPVGMWLLVQLPPTTQRLMMGGSGWATGLLLVGIFTSLGLMHFLASMAFGKAGREPAPALRGRAGAAVALGVIVVLVMTGAAQCSRPRPAKATSPADTAASDGNKLAG